MPKLFTNIALSSLLFAICAQVLKRTYLSTQGIIFLNII